MGFRWPVPAVAFVSSALVALLVAACAEGSNAEPEGEGDADAGAVEAAALPPRPEAGEPEPETDAGDEDAGPSVSPACAAALDKAKFDFEGSDQGWTHRASDNAESQTSWPFDPWTRGTATTITCPDGECWGSERNQNYAQCGRGELISPKIDLLACKDATVSLVFTHAYAFWTGNVNGQDWFDGGIVEISKDGGATWEVPQAAYPGTVKILGSRGGYNCVLPNAFHVHGKSGFTEAQPAPTAFEIEIPAASLTANMRVRFSQASGVSTAVNGHAREGTAAGWRIDDLHFEAK